jgi:hypothetical protein
MKTQGNKAVKMPKTDEFALQPAAILTLTWRIIHGRLGWENVEKCGAHFNP